MRKNAIEIARSSGNHLFLEPYAFRPADPASFKEGHACESRIFQDLGVIEGTATDLANHDNNIRLKSMQSGRIFES
jgi:hypothetical protein